jgi:hypothetical protein
MTIVCEGFKPRRSNTLYGFCEILVSEIGLRIKDLSVHQKNAARWVSLPSKPMLKDGMHIKGQDGKGAYATILEFCDPAIRSAFSSAVIAALLEFAPSAFADDPARPAGNSSNEPAPANAPSDRDQRVRGTPDASLNDEIPF